MHDTIFLFLALLSGVGIGYGLYAWQSTNSRIKQQEARYEEQRQEHKEQYERIKKELNSIRR